MQNLPKLTGKLRHNPDIFRHFPPFSATLIMQNLSKLTDKLRHYPDKIPTKSAIFRHPHYAKSVQTDGQTSPLSRQNPTFSAIFRHAMPLVLCAFCARKTNFFAHKPLFGSLGFVFLPQGTQRGTAVSCPFYVRKQNFFGHKNFDAMMRQFFIPRSRAGRATQWPLF